MYERYEYNVWLDVRDVVAKKPYAAYALEHCDTLRSRGVARLEQLNKLHAGNRDANGIILRNVWRKLGLDILVQQKT